MTCFFLKKNGPIPASFVYFRLFPHFTIKYIDESVDGKLGTRTWGGRMEGQINPLSYGGIPDIGTILTIPTNKKVYVLCLRLEPGSSRW